MACSKSSVPFIPSAFLMFCGYILGIVGVFSTHWSQWSHSAGDSADIGLWEFCWNEGTHYKSRTCFTFSSRHVTVMVFVCSAMSVIGLIFVTFATIGSLLALTQKRSRTIRWTRNCGVLAILADCGLALSVALYAGTFHDIDYSAIPNWTRVSSDLTLGWAFIVSCTAAVVVFCGAVLGVYVALNEASKSKIIPMNPSQLTPSVTLHPPPSSRTLSAFQFSPPPSTRTLSSFQLSMQPRVMSPLPFSRSKLLSQSPNN